MVATPQEPRSGATSGVPRSGAARPADSDRYAPAAQPKQVLMVSADAATLAAWRHALRLPDPGVEAASAADGAAALEWCADRAVDVAFVDLRLPESGGLALLAELKTSHPGALRVAVANPDEPEALQAAAVAHRLLPRTGASGAVRAYLEHAAALRATMQDERIRLLVGGVGSLPSVPRLYAALTRLLAEPYVSIDDVARLVAEDVGVAAKILQVVNSPLFGILRPVTTMRAAVAVLGVGTIRTLVLATEAVRLFSNSNRAAALAMEQLQAHSLAVASLATQLLPERLGAEEVFTAAVLHDLGKLVLLDRCPDLFAYLGRTAEQRGAPLHRVELEVLGITHAEIGAYLIHLWQLPDSIVTAVASHHLPSRPSATELALVLHVADALLHGRNPATPRGTDARLDRESLRRFELDDRLPVWEAIASRFGARSYPG